MVKRFSPVIATGLLAVGLMAFTVPARATTMYQAFLNSAQQTTPNGSTGVGYGTVLLDDSMAQITVNEWWSGVGAPVTASHIHTAPAGANGPVTFPFSGVPSSTTGSIPQQSFAISAAQLANLNAGNMYFNVHTTQFPGGEIRGQIAAVPEPGTAAMLLTAAPGALWMLRRRKVA
jgi:hypothetical protein